MHTNDERAEFLRKLDGTRQRIERFINELQLALQTWTVADFHRDCTLADMRQFHREVVEAIESVRQGRPITNRMRAIERRVLAPPAEC